MSKVDINQHSVEIICSKCAKKTKEAIGGLKKNPDIICPSCGVIIHVNTDMLSSNIQCIQESSGKLSATFKISDK